MTSPATDQTPGAVPPMSPEMRRRSLTAINITAFLAGIAMGATMPLISVAMEIRGADARHIGFVVAAAPTALLCSAPFMDRFMRWFSVLGAILSGTLLIVISLLLMPAFYGVLPWIALRFLGGIGIAVVWILGETWINAVATEESRGKVIAVYMILLSAGFALGPLLIRFVGVETWTPFYLAAALIGGSVVPLLIARKAAPVLPEPAPQAFRRSFRTAPVVMACAVLAGVTDSAQISFFPVYGMRMGLGEDIALYMLIAIVAGNAFVQLPVGWFADKVDRQKLLLGCLVVCFAMGALVPWVLDHRWLVWPVLVAWGGAAFALYTVALILLGQRFPANELAGANAAFVTTFELGSIGGPVAVGYAMDMIGPNGMILVLVAACLPLFALWVWRQRTRRRVAATGRQTPGQ